MRSVIRLVPSSLVLPAGLFALLVTLIVNFIALGQGAPCCVWLHHLLDAVGLSGAMSQAVQLGELAVHAVGLTAAVVLGGLCGWSFALFYNIVMVILLRLPLIRGNVRDKVIYLTRGR